MPTDVAKSGGVRGARGFQKLVGARHDLATLNSRSHTRPTLNVARKDRKLRVLIGVKPGQIRNSGKVPKTHSIGSVGDHNLSVFAITEIALKNGPCGPANALYLRGAKHGLRRLVKAPPVGVRR